jgi:hypothetical protein
MPAKTYANVLSNLHGAGKPASLEFTDSSGGPYQVRTGDLLNAIEALYQLS